MGRLEFLLQVPPGRWKRRFGNRAETDGSPSDESPPELQPDPDRPYLLNNKIYPGTGTPGGGKDKVMIATIPSS